VPSGQNSLVGPKRQRDCKQLFLTVQPADAHAACFANSQGRHRNENTSLGPFSGYEQQNCLTAGTGLRTTPRDIRGVEGKKETAPAQCFSKCNKDTKMILNIVLGIRQLFTDFCFSRGYWNLTTAKARDNCVGVTFTLDTHKHTFS